MSDSCTQRRCCVCSFCGPLASLCQSMRCSVTSRSASVAGTDSRHERLPHSRGPAADSRAYVVRPYRSSSRTTSWSSGVDTSKMSQSVIAVMRWTVPGVTWTASPSFISRLTSFPFLDLEQHPAGPEEDRLVLLVVVLQAEGVPGVDVNQLADVPVGLRPVQLVAPRLVHSCHLFRHVSSFFSRALRLADPASPTLAGARHSACRRSCDSGTLAPRPGASPPYPDLAAGRDSRSVVPDRLLRREQLEQVGSTSLTVRAASARRAATRASPARAGCGAPASRAASRPAPC